MASDSDEHEHRGAARSRPHGFADAFEAEREQFFLWSPVFLGLGIAGYFALPVEPPLGYAAAPLAVALIVRVLASRRPLASVLATAMILVAAGLVLAKMRVESVRAPVLTKSLRNVDVEGVVTHTESRAPRGQRLTIAVERLGDLDAITRPVIVHVRTLSPKIEVKPGDRVRLKANLSAPAKPALPGGFDYARLAWFERVGGVGYAYAAPVILGRGAPNTPGDRWSQGIESLRITIAARIRAALPGEVGAIATALITGERGGISTETNSAFKNSGLFHILSISGLHMVIMAGAVFYCVRLLLAAIPLLALTLPVKKIAALAGIAGALAYLTISGGAFATVRSAVMIVIIFGAVLLDRPALALRNVALAAFVILMVYPESLLDAGFQMSFAAVTALIASHRDVSRLLPARSSSSRTFGLVRFFAEIVASTLVASVAVAPLAAYQFHQSQQYAVLANVIAIPICNIVVMPAALAAMLLMPLGLEALALKPMGWGIEAMTWCAEAVAAIPGAVGHVKAMPELAFVLLLAGGLWLSLWRTRMRLAGAAAAIVGLMLAPWMARPDALVARGGALVAVRDDRGLLTALPAKQSKFDLERWLEYDGDGRSAAEAQQSAGFACDAVGCVARVKGARLAVTRHPAAVPDDCGAADIMVLNQPRPRSCANPVAVIDVFDLWRNGAYALYVEGGEGGQPLKVRFETVAQDRGERPWSMPPPPRPAVRGAVDALLAKPHIVAPSSGWGLSGNEPGHQSGQGPGLRPGEWTTATPPATPMPPVAPKAAKPRSTAQDDPGEQPSEQFSDQPSDPTGGEQPAASGEDAPQ